MGRYARGVLQVGLTGNVAAGKSSVARLWAAAGVPVISADELAREVVAPGSDGLKEVVATFGEHVLQPDGSLDRAALRARVFADPEQRATLERILHPRIRAGRAAWVATHERAPLVVCEIPLLFETHTEHEVDCVVLVDAPASERRRRLIEDRGLAAGEADRILAAQMDPAEKRARADYVLDNAGSRADLEASATALLAELRRRAAAQ